MVWDRRATGFAVLGTAAALVLAVAGVVLFTHRQADLASSSQSAPQRPLVSPFTGERVPALRRVLAVKIGNTAPERPPTGLSSADVVYMIPVEGGLSRNLAVFSSRYPRVVGPVRSAREDDLALLRQFGRPALAYSGATPALLPVIHRARIVDLYDGIAGGYFRSTVRFAPYNLYAHTRQLLAQSQHASRAHGIGFRVGPPPPGGRAARSMSVSYPAASFRFTWSAAKGRWLVWMDGARARSTEAGWLGASTVVIQYTTVRTSRFLEYGHRPPYAETIGTGRAVVLRNGKAYKASWSRPNADGGTTFTTATGQPMTFAPGPVWIILTARS